MLHSTLLYCAATLAAAKSRGGPSWTAAQREHFATNGYVLQPDVIRPPSDRDASEGVSSAYSRASSTLTYFPTSGTGEKEYEAGRVPRNSQRLEATTAVACAWRWTPRSASAPRS